MQHTIQFYKNSPDSTRCVLACMQMVLKMLEPEKEYTFDELDTVVHKKGLMGVWHFAPLTYIATVAQRVGSVVVVVEQFPYTAFRFFPTLTCLYFFGWSAGLWQVLLSALRREAKFVKSFLAAPIQFQSRIPTLADLTKFLDDGYICLVQLNGYMIDGEPGYGGHMVLVVGYDAHSITVHNPRLPGSAYRHYARDVFEAAWHSPHVGCANLYAIRLPTRSPNAPTMTAA